MTERIAEASPRFKARIAGVSQLLEALTAGFGQVIVLDRLVVAGNAAGGVPPHMKAAALLTQIEAVPAARR